MFPLNTVLFPGMVLPLHIFEERYKLMINRCLEEGRPFGVLLVRQGSEVEEGPESYAVGTTSLIAGVSRMDDGRMNIVTIGHERFRLRAVHYGQPYLVGEAEPWPLTGARAKAARAQVMPVRGLFRRYIGLLERAAGHKIGVEEMPDEPRLLALLIAIALQLPMAEKQRLLTQPTVAQMLSLEQTILKREQALLRFIIRTQEDQLEGGYSGWLSRN